MATTKTKPVKEERMTRAQVINHLNAHFRWMRTNIRFKESDSVYGIEVYIKGDVFRKDSHGGMDFTDYFFKMLRKQILIIGIHSEIQWNNGKNVFACWINSNTCAWDK